MKQILLMAVALVLVGCGTTNWEVATRNLATLNIGMSKSEVLQIMGPADKTEAYETKAGGVMEFLIYLTNFEGAPPTRDSNYTPICIIDGKLKGWGRNYYDDTIKIRKEIIKNP